VYPINRALYVNFINNLLMREQKGKENYYSSRQGGEKEDLNSSQYSSKGNNQENSRSPDKYPNYEDLDKSQKSQTNESGFREGGVYLYDPYDTSNFNRASQSPITQGRQTTNIMTTENSNRSPEGKKSIFAAVRNDFNVGDPKRDDLSSMTINIPKRGGVKQREGSPGLIHTGSEDEKEEIMNTYIPRRAQQNSQKNNLGRNQMNTKGSYISSNYYF
jgi:hypothetical protein